MSKVAIEVEGYVSQDPELRFTPSNKAVVTISVPHTPRRLNKQTKEWEDAGETVWHKLDLWEDDAHLAAETIRKGTLVVLRAENYEVQTYDRKDGTVGTNLVLRFGTVAIVQRARRNGGSGYQPDERFAPGDEPWGAPSSSPQSDPWGSVPPPSGPTDGYGDDTPF